MKGDFSRVTFDPARHVHGVLMQQGRVQLDADWNELQAVQSHRAETESVDVVGPNGTPKLGDGFRITLAGADQLTVGKGRMYVDGQLVENDRDVLLTAQPDLPGYQLPTVPGRYVAFLDQRLRELTARDDGSIREVALGGPDTAIRERRVWQVKLLRVGDHDPTATCASTGDVVALHPADRGTLRARAETGSAGSRPCIVAPDAAFRGVENQLYRVEIHRGGDATTATFVWSRDNGCVAADWLTGNVGVNRIRVGGFGRDGLPGFRPNQWVELLDDTNVLFDNTTPPRHDAVDPTGRPGELVQLQDVLDDVLVLAGAPPARGELHPTVRGWDVTDGAIAISATTTDDGYFELESGVQVAFDQAATYTAGDYWLIPARTIIATIEWPKHAGGPAAKPPDGIRPHYAPLALLTTADGAAWTVLDDCRARFPALTAITAEDVEFDNKNCALPGADNVQEALDALCARTDLKKHNKHLHGWGVVDGLQVECCTDNTPAGSVTVRRGYAIDSEGNDRDLAADEIFDVSGAAVAARLLDRSGGADLDLWFDSGDPRPVFKVGQHVPRQDTAREIFDGTIWVDFIKRVVERLQDFVKSEFTVPEGGEKEPVGPIQKRVTTVSNLIVQLLNPTSGAGVFISLTEHQILLKLYSGLKALLSSPTFCGMWDNARPFPDYPFTDKNMETIFTKGLHHRLRVHPGGKVGCSVGMDHRIHLFDLTTSTMVAVLDHPAGIGSRVTDVAFTKDGSALYATAVLGSDTIFATADIALPTANWRPHSIICGVQLVTLATAFDVSDFVYAVSTGQGLYAVNPVNVESHPTPAIAFAATGAFSVAENTGIAYAVSKTGSDFAVMGLQLATNSNLTSLPLPGVDRVHDLLAVTEPGDQLGVLLAATNTPGQSGSSVAFARLVSGRLDQEFMFFPATTERSSPMSLGFQRSSRTVLIAVADANSLIVQDVVAFTGASAARPHTLPMQISPVDVQSPAGGSTTYVLNQTSNTITAIPAGMLKIGTTFDSGRLIEYRNAALNALADLFGGLLQYLKDSFAELLLVNPPSPPADDRIFLCCVHLKKFKVYQVCNFAKRRYVKSFPTVGYWLSIVPIIPLIARAVQIAGCAILPDQFGKFKAEEQGRTGDWVTTSNFQAGFALFDQLTKFTWPDLNGNFKGLGPIVTSFLSTMAARKPETRVNKTDIVGRPVVDARTALTDRGVVVERVETFDPSRGVTNVVRSTVAPVNLPPGSRVTLIEQDGVVRYYSTTRPADQEDFVALTRALGEAQQSIVQRDSDVQNLRGQLQALTIAQAQIAAVATPERLQEIEQLKDNLEAARVQLAARDAEITALRESVGQLRVDVGNAPLRLSTIEAELRKLRDRRAPDDPGNPPR